MNSLLLFCLRCEKVKMNFLELLVFFGVAIVLTSAQFPASCSCPDSCICDLEDQTIDCVNQRLKHVPVELNSCSWPGITKVDLSGNRIRLVHEFAFSLLGNITHLYLYDNLIADVDRSAFIGLHSLEYLFLDGNQLVSLPYTAFWPLRHLKRLLLYGNLLTGLPLGIFQSQHLLTQLALYDNRFSTIRTDFFDDLPLLQELYLHNNHITDLSGSPFRSLRQLQTLYLNENGLTRLTRFDFLGLNRVSRLLLSNNQIASIEDDTFQPTPKLQFLYLENNQLSHINLLMFAGSVELLELRLFGNQIERISNGAFFRLRKLQKLHVYSNQLTQINDQTFVGLDSLTELTLYSNRIRFIPNDTFDQCPLLEQLWLYNNELSCIEEAAFRGLNNLQLLQLGQNRLAYLPENVFIFTPSLVYLLLYSNDFRSIVNRPFRNLHNLVQLGLTSNSIEYIAEGALEGANLIYYFQWSTLQSPNALICDCSALWLYQWMVSRTMRSSVICIGPKEFEGQDIRSLKPASFGCSANNLRVSLSRVEYVVAKGGCLRLECSSIPRGPVQWARVDGEPLHGAVESCSSVSPCGGGHGKGVLVMEGAREDDGGHYICTASFQNKTAAGVCHVIIGDPPTLLEEPEELVLPHPGVVARLHLKFSGSPWPEVSWFHVSLSGDVVSLIESGPEPRYYITRNGSLVIPVIRLEDEGAYRAIVRNEAGEMSVEVPLSFLFESSCHTSCFNGGMCEAISICMCPSQYQGTNCEEETEIEPTEATPTIPTTAGSGSLIDPPYSGYGPDVELIDNTESATPRECTEEGSGCNAPTLQPDTEGLIDDEDYSVTEPTNQEHPNTGSGSGSGTTLEPGTKLGSGMGQDTQGMKHSRRRRSDVGTMIQTDSRSNEPAANLQSIVREIVERKRLFEVRFGEAKMLSKARQKIEGISSFVSTKETSVKLFGDKIQRREIHHESMEDHGYVESHDNMEGKGQDNMKGSKHDNTMHYEYEVESAAIYLYKEEEGLDIPDMHRA